MRKYVRKTRISLVAVMTLSLAAALLPAVAAAQEQSAQQVATSQIQVGENTVLQHDDPRPTRGRDAAAVAVNPADPDHIVMANADLYHFTCEYHTSRDGGATWSSGTLTAPAGFGAPAGTPTEPCSPIGHGTSSFMGSHAISFGSGNNVYVAFASARGEESLSAFVARSTDGGDTFSTGVVAMPGAEGRSPNRFPGVVAYPRDGQDDRVVVVAHDSTAVTVTVDGQSVPNPNAGPTPRSAVFAVSEDGGQTWSERDRINEEGQEANEVNLAQGPDGELYVSWRDYAPLGELRMARSTDGGETWANTHVADAAGYHPPTGSPFGSSNFPRNTVGPEGNVYLTWMEGPLPPAAAGDVQAQDHFIHPDADIFLARSTDGGQTWSDRVQVSDDTPDNDGNIWHQTRHPDVSTAPNGRVDVVWQDRRHWYRGCQHTHDECNEGRFGDTYWSQSTDGGQTFSDDIRVSDRTQNNEVGSDYRQGVYWSYSPVAAALGNDELFVTWMDSRRGNFTTDALDLFYSKIDLNAGGDSVPVRQVPAAGPVDLSVAMARHAYPGGSEATLISTFATEPWTRLVVVNEDDPAAATAGAVLARAYMGPVLATPAGGLTARVRDEAARMEPLGAFVLGGTSAVSDAAVSQLREATGLAENAVTRFGGAPAAMAADVAREMDWRGERADPYTRPEDAPAFEAAVIVNPASDEASTAAALAANRRLPVLFVDEGEVPPATSEVLTDLGIDETLVVGGTASVSDTVLNALPNATRLGGNDIYATSRAVAEEALARGMPANVVYVSDGDNPMETALMGAAAGRITGLQIATPDGATGPAQTVLNGLGVGGVVDRYIAAGPLGVRQTLSWACPEGAVPGSGFVDVAGNVHATAIECAAWYGITAGGPGGLPANQYGPGLPVRRDQMASFIARMLDHASPGALPAAAGPNPFPGDLTEGNAHFDAIRRLAAAGIVQGGPGGLPADQYGPAQSVRRDQMGSFIHRAIEQLTGQQIITDASFFADLGGVHVDNVNALASEGIVVGVGEGQYAGGRAVRRDQMASFVNRGLDYLTQRGQSQRPVLSAR